MTGGVIDVVFKALGFGPDSVLLGLRGAEGQGPESACAGASRVKEGQA